VRRFRLEGTFPGAKRLYNTATVRKLAAKWQWEVAAAFVGEDDALRRVLVEEAVTAGEVVVAVELANRFGLQTAFTEADIAAAAAAAAADGGRFLPLGAARERVLVVDSPATLAAAAAALADADVIGMDAEWRARLCLGALATNPTASHRSHGSRPGG